MTKNNPIIQRRRLLQASVLTGVTALSGCAGEPAEDDGEEDGPEEAEHSATSVWEFEAANTFRVAPVYRDGSLFIPNADARIYAIDAQSGDEIWTHRLEDELRSTLATSDETVFTPRDGEYNYALSQESGEIIWKTDDHFFRGTPEYEDGVLFFSRGGIGALDPATGDRLWEYEADVYANSPIRIGGGLAVTPGTSEIHAVDKENGEEMWNFRPDGDPHTGGFAVSSDYVVFRADDDRIYVLDTETGDQITRMSTAGSDVILLDGVLYYPDVPGVVAYEIESGEQLWEKETPDYVLASSSLARSMIDGFLVFARRRVGVGIIDMSDGSIYELLEFDWTPHVGARPLVVDNVVYLVDNDHSLHALEIELD